MLGETGAGKSTWINAFANYLKYSTLEDAVNANGFKVHIPFSFVKTDDEFNEKRFSFGNLISKPYSSGDLRQDLFSCDGLLAKIFDDGKMCKKEGHFKVYMKENSC